MQKPFKLDMGFSEALARIAQTPKPAEMISPSKTQEPKAVKKPPRPSRRKAA